MTDRPGPLLEAAGGPGRSCRWVRQAPTGMGINKAAAGFIRYRVTSRSNVLGTPFSVKVSGCLAAIATGLDKATPKDRIVAWFP